jgi:Flp pilus assembly protein TadD
MPYVPELHHNVALLLAGQGRFQEAVRHFSEVLRLQPKSADARRTLSTAENNWGAALFNQGELGAAIERFMQALQVDPANESARSNLSKALAVRRGAAKPSVRR